MKTYTMSQTLTRGWENDDAKIRDWARKVARRTAATLAGPGEKVEIVSCDGIVMDVIQADGRGGER